MWMRTICFLLLAATVLAATERDAAEWVIRSGGGVMLAGSRKTLRDVVDLPRTDIHVTGVDLTGTTIEPKELKMLSGLTGLVDLYLPGPSFSPFSGTKLDANDELKSLGNLTNIERLYFSVHFLPTYDVQDKGIAALAAMTKLKELRLPQSQVVKPDLFRFEHLRALDLSDSTFSDEGMKGLPALRELRRLNLRNTPITDEGLKQLAHLGGLQELDLYGVKVTDRGIESLRGLTQLRKLNLLGAELTDAGMDVLAGMKQLKVLNLYGLAKLATLKDLAELDVRYSRVTQTGIAAFRSALPSCEVEFVGSSLTKKLSAAATRPAGNGDPAIAQWVTAIGGKPDLRSGKLVGISLTATPVTDSQLMYLSALSHLEKLNLSGTETGDLGLAALKSLHSLQELLLNNTTVSDTGLTQLSELTKLRKLGLQGTFVHGSGLASLHTMTDLLELDLTSSQLNDAGLQNIGEIVSLERLFTGFSNVTNAGLPQLTKLPHLQMLSVEGTETGDEGLRVIGKLSSLRELSLNSCRFTPKGLQYVAALTNLERLDLLRTTTNDESLAALASLKHLKMLNLNYTAVDDQGMASLKAMPELRELRLNMAKVTDASIGDLSTLHDLRVLNLYHTLVTEKGVAQLKNALPACAIVFDRDSALPTRRGRA
jgi:Leucine-rich repeat (LRR) protein